MVLAHVGLERYQVGEQIYVYILTKIDYQKSLGLVLWDYRELVNAT